MMDAAEKRWTAEEIAEAARRIEGFKVEVARLKAERDHLFAWAVDNLNHFHPLARAIEAVLRVMQWDDGPDGAALDALNDHDRKYAR